MFLTFSFAAWKIMATLNRAIKSKLLGFCHFHFNFLTDVRIAQLEIIF